MNKKAFGASVGISIGITYISDTALFGFRWVLDPALITLVGIGVSSVSYFALNYFANRWKLPALRYLTVFISTPMAVIAGFIAGHWLYYLRNIDRIQAHDRLAMLNIGVSALLGAVVAGIFGLIYGIWLGQLSHQKLTN